MILDLSTDDGDGGEAADPRDVAVAVGVGGATGPTGGAPPVPAWKWFGSSQPSNAALDLSSPVLSVAAALPAAAAPQPPTSFISPVHRASARAAPAPSPDFPNGTALMEEKPTATFAAHLYRSDVGSWSGVCVACRRTVCAGLRRA